jgi:hypothetical protein
LEDNATVLSERVDLEVVNERVDSALALNRRAETIVIAMAASIFVLGLAVIGVAYWVRNPYITSGAVLLQGLLYWPIREILKLRRENLMLQTLPTLIANLPRERAAQEISKALAFLRR